MTGGAQQRGPWWRRIPSPSPAVLGWATVLSLVVAVVALYPSFRQSGPDLRLVKVSAEETAVVPATYGFGDEAEAGTTTAAVLDIRVLNRGGAAASITDIGVVVEQVVPVDICIAIGGFQSTTARYDLTIPDDARPGDSYRAPAAQVVPAGEADRFSLTIGLTEEGSSAIGGAAYRFRLVAYAGDETTELGPISLLLPPTAANTYRYLATEADYAEQVDLACAARFRESLSGIGAPRGNPTQGLTQLLSDLKIAVTEGLDAVPPPPPRPEPSPDPT